MLSGQSEERNSLHITTAHEDMVSHLRWLRVELRKLSNTSPRSGGKGARLMTWGSRLSIVQRRQLWLELPSQALWSLSPVYLPPGGWVCFPPSSEPTASDLFQLIKYRSLTEHHQFQHSGDLIWNCASPPQRLPSTFKAQDKFSFSAKLSLGHFQVSNCWAS